MAPNCVALAAHFLLPLCQTNHCCNLTIKFHKALNDMVELPELQAVITYIMKNKMNEHIRKNSERECFLHTMTSPLHLRRRRLRSVCVFACVLMTRHGSTVCFLQAEFRWHHLSNRTLAYSDCWTQTHQVTVWLVFQSLLLVFSWALQATDSRLMTSSCVSVHVNLFLPCSCKQGCIIACSDFLEEIDMNF